MTNEFSSDSPQTRPFFIDSGNTNIVFAKNNFQTPKISGSRTDSLFQKYLDIEFQIKSDIRKKKELLKSKGLADSLIDSILAEEELTIIRVALDLAKENPESVLSAYLLRYFMHDIDDAKLSSVYNLLGTSSKQSFYGKAVQNKLLVGKGGVAPLFEGITIDNLHYSLAKSLLDKKIILLMFWASWCKPCREEMPYFLELLAKFKQKGFEIVALANERKDTVKWKEAIEKDKTNSFVHLLQNNTMPDDAGKLYSIMPIPTIIIVDNKGFIIYRKTGGPYEEIEKVLTTCF
jgi:thiol-disulfide isomerase/thioredoxin